MLLEGISVEKLKPLESCAKVGEEIHHINELRTRTEYVGKERITMDIESGEGSNVLFVFLYFFTIPFIVKKN